MTVRNRTWIIVAAVAITGGMRRRPVCPWISLDGSGPGRLGGCAGNYFSVGVTHWPAPTPYGTTVVVGDITCQVEQTGVRCSNADQQGLSLSRRAFATF